MKRSLAHATDVREKGQLFFKLMCFNFMRLLLARLRSVKCSKTSLLRIHQWKLACICFTTCQYRSQLYTTQSEAIITGNTPPKETKENDNFALKNGGQILNKSSLCRRFFKILKFFDWCVSEKKRNWGFLNLKSMYRWAKFKGDDSNRANLIGYNRIPSITFKKFKIPLKSVRAGFHCT